MMNLVAFENYSIYRLNLIISASGHLDSIYDHGQAIVVSRHPV